MRDLVRKAVTAAAVAATTIALTLVPASAAPITWTAFPGGAITGHNTQVLRFLNPHDGVTVICNLSTVGGTLQSGTGLPGAGIASLTSATSLGGCAAVGIAPASVTPTNLPWSFNAVSYDGTDVVTGTLTGVAFTITIHTSPSCTMTIGGPGGGPGTLSATFRNSTDILDVSGTLVVQTVSGACAGLAHVGDPIYVALQYQLTSGQTITSP